jgi:dihydrofolate reductase
MSSQVPPAVRPPVTRVVLVAARAANGVIGRDGDIPWKIPADFAHFKRLTVGHPLVLGRTTFEGIGAPLPDRQSIVVTRNPDWAHEGVLVARSVEEAIAIGADLDDTVNVGGGEQVYRDALPLATDQVLTEVDLEPEGDTHYPEFVELEWHETRRERHLDHDPPYETRWLERAL